MVDGPGGEPREPPDVQNASTGGGDPDAWAVDAVTLVVRQSDDPPLELDRDFEVATVLKLSVGDRHVPAEAIKDDVLRWLLEAGGPTVQSEFAVQRRHADIGATGVDALIVLSILSGAAGGISTKLTEEAIDLIRDRLSRRVGPMETLTQAAADVEGMRFAAARAFDLRPSNLRLVEQRSSRHHYAAVFEDPTGRFYGARAESSGAVTVRRLEEGDW